MPDSIPVWRTVEHTDNLGWTVLPHSPYSPDLVPSDSHLFGPMKDRPCRQCFPSNYAVIAAVKQWFTSTGADFRKRSMQTLVHCQQECIGNGGDYVERQSFVAENLLYQTVCVLCICCSFHENKYEALLLKPLKFAVSASMVQTFRFSWHASTTTSPNCYAHEVGIHKAKLFTSKLFRYWPLFCKIAL